MYFVHLGAGAGDQDQRANFRCGFTEYIKKKHNKKSRVFVVEANPLNIEKLKICYKYFENIQINNFAISTKNSDKLTFFKVLLVDKSTRAINAYLPCVFNFIPIFT